MHPPTNNGPAQYSIRGRSTINEPTPSTQSLHQRRLDKEKPVSSTQSQRNECSTSTCVLGHQHDGNDGRGGTVNKMMGEMEDKDNNMSTRGTNGRSLSDLPPRVYIHNCYRASPGLSCHDCTSQALFRAHMGNLGKQLNTC